MPVLLLAVLIVFLAPAAMAQNYAPLTYGNVLKTLARFDALSLQNDDVLDDYAKLNDCDNFYKNYRDDFAAQARRKSLREEIKQQRGDYPDAYYFTSDMKLDRYDFKAHMLRLEKESRLMNVNSFRLVRVNRSGVCIKDETLKTLPEEIGVTLDQPVTIEGLPIGEEAARQLIERMNKVKNFKRVIHVRFSLQLVYAPVMGIFDKARRYDAEAQLLAIEFFEDKKMTQPIWIYNRA